MEVFVNSLNAISPQDTFTGLSLPDIVKEYRNTRSLKCIEPKYSEFIDPMSSRRMSRIVKMGLTSALSCLKLSGIEQPGAIITGTGLGCIEDTTKFLNSMYENEEKLLNPTPFIQSTHNTLSSSIAQTIKCNNYNSTWCDTGFSFENALLDAMMLLEEKSADNVLVGSSDELTDTLFKITDRLGFWKRKPVDNLELFSGSSRGSIAGEGAAFFLLGSRQDEKSYCRIDSVKTLYDPECLTDIEAFLTEVLENNGVPDMVIMGYNGDSKQDKIYDHLRRSIFASCPVAGYKHLCGEYHTSVSFALYLAARIMKEQEVPQVIRLSEFPDREIRRILIYNHSREKSHSAILISRC